MHLGEKPWVKPKNKGYPRSRVMSKGSWEKTDRSMLISFNCNTQEKKWNENALDRKRLYFDNSY